MKHMNHWIDGTYEIGVLFFIGLLCLCLNFTYHSFKNDREMIDIIFCIGSWCLLFGFVFFYYR